MLPWFSRPDAGAAERPARAATTGAGHAAAQAAWVPTPRNMAGADSASEALAGRPACRPACTICIDTRAGLATLTYLRQPTFEEWQAGIDQLLGAREFRPGMHVLSDRRALTDSTAISTLHRMSSYMAERSAAFARCRWAVVTHPDNPADFGMARMAEALYEAAAGITLRAFTDHDTALAWLARGPQ